MKKLFTSILTIMLIFRVSLTVYAADANWTSTESVNLNKTQNEFNLEVAVNSKESYAGGEFGIQCGDGVTIKSVTYNNSSSKAGPTLARGLTWFSFFSGNNDFNGEVKAKVTLEYTGTQNTSVVIDNVNVYTKNKTKVETEKFTPRKVISVNREGASNPVEPPKPPENGGNNDGGNPNSPNEGNDDNNNGSEGNSGEISNSGTDNSSGSQSNNNEDVAIGGSSENSNEDDTTTNTNNDSKSSGQDKKDSTKENGEKKSEDNNDIQNNKKSLISPTIVIILIISLGVNGVLGYFIIKNKNKK